MGCAQSKFAGGGSRGGTRESNHARDGLGVGRDDKLPRTDSPLTARPSQNDEEVQKPRSALASSALSSVTYGSLAEHRKSASRRKIEPRRVEDAAAGREEDGGRQERGGGDSEVQQYTCAACLLKTHDAYVILVRRFPPPVRTSTRVRWPVLATTRCRER